MILELYLWLWPKMNRKHVLKRVSYLFGLALMLIGPLLYMNVELIRQGFKPSQAKLSIEADRGAYSSGIYPLPEEE